MKITPKQYAISLYETTKNAPKDEVPKLAANFVKLLQLNNSLSMADKIIDEYYRYYRKQKGISKIKITSSEKLPAEAINNIVKHFSNQIEMEENVDERLIGGVTIEIDDNVLIDGSVRKKLEILKKNIA